MPPSSATTNTGVPSPLSTEEQLRIASAAVYEKSRELNQKNQELNELSLKLTDANTKLSELDKLKSNLLELATHRLRGPLASIRGYASMMVEGGFGTDLNAIKEASSKIDEASTSMETMIDEFLVASSLASNAVHFNMTPFDMGGSLRGVIAKLSPLAATKQLQIASEIDPHQLIVNGDPDYINRALMTVIDNAIRYTPDKGSISIKLAPGSDRSMIRFEVKDTGIGMTADTISKLFSQFLRAENAFKFYVWGNGLGLYIAKQIIDGHSGIIQASSEGEGKGSAMVIELPSLSPVLSTPPPARSAAKLTPVVLDVPTPVQQEASPAKPSINLIK